MLLKIIYITYIVCKPISCGTEDAIISQVMSANHQSRADVDGSAVINHKLRHRTSPDNAADDGIDEAAFDVSALSEYSLKSFIVPFTNNTKYSVAIKLYSRHSSPSSSLS